MTAGRRVSMEDWVSVSDQLGRYAQHLDNGAADDFVALFTEDGVIDTGVLPEPIAGSAALHTFVGTTYEYSERGQLRHLTGSLYCEYGASRDEIAARFYNLVTGWSGGIGTVRYLSLARATLVRRAGGWLIQHLELKLMNGSS
jgi:SnoaL-like protein